MLKKRGIANLKFSIKQERWLTQTVIKTKNIKTSAMGSGRLGTLADVEFEISPCHAELRHVLYSDFVCKLRDYWVHEHCGGGNACIGSEQGGCGCGRLEQWFPVFYPYRMLCSSNFTFAKLRYIQLYRLALTWIWLQKHAPMWFADLEFLYFHPLYNKRDMLPPGMVVLLPQTQQNTPPLLHARVVMEMLPNLSVP